jgi:GTP-binding protein HflX
MLSPGQQRNLERALDIKVIDRAALILDVFARHARTREGQLQVELAQHQYLLPRLAGQWQHLERLGGGIGTRGPGETQIETDRRIIRNKVERLKREIDQLRKQRALHRRQRQQQGVPVISLVGYTNAGKSTLLNAMTKSDVITANKLFATLDPTTRRIVLPGGKHVLMTDTVGFIHKLPPTIASAFRATLEEIEEASIIVHVVDGAASNAAEQCQTVEHILSDLHLDEKPRLTVINKIDRLLDDSQKWNEQTALDYFLTQPLPVSKDTLHVSALKRWGLVTLAQSLARMLPDGSQR